MEDTDAAKMLELMREDLLTLVQYHAHPCAGRGDDVEPMMFPALGMPLCCTKLATRAISWSDREMHVCEEHLAYAKWCAANDGSGDRTDDPYVREFENDEIVVRYWPEVLKLGRKPGT